VVYLLMLPVAQIVWHVVSK